jgi:hypothetical protein
MKFALRKASDHDKYKIVDINDLEELKSIQIEFGVHLIVDFSKDWYRPDLKETQNMGSITIYDQFVE